ncbi:hypothetical protein [Desulfolucanica intricata]|uniref:hypothetical protein n=1 Tax=Desulfolucanica intricata TaxID=1285191 RepID=UPI000835A363|nr:hypothetical protein [Desulfolucanica intricata]
MIGLSMIVLTVIFGAAALFRKKILDWFTESAARTISSRMKPSMQKTRDTLKMVRNVGIADGVMDWMSLRHIRDNMANTTARNPQSLDTGRVDAGRFPKVLAPEDKDNGLKGQPQGEFLYKNTTSGGKLPKKEKAVIDLNNMRAIPDRVLESNNFAGIQEPIEISNRGSEDNQSNDYKNN